MMSMLGMVMLVGIVVNNAIVLVDYINRLRLDGMERDAAIVRAVQVRFRPIWMTALTTIFGLVPLIVLPQQGEGVDYKPLAVVLAGGLTTSTFFTLSVVPLLYTFLDDLRAKVSRLLRLETRELWRCARLGRGGP
jgi:HAE1 family hydrophobic/amphiphilic exporter-1